MGERFSSPSGCGRSPAAKRYLVNFRLKISPSVATIFRSFSGTETSNWGTGWPSGNILDVSPLTFLIFVPQGFLRRILRRRGCLWTPLRGHVFNVSVLFGPFWRRIYMTHGSPVVALVNNLHSACDSSITIQYNILLLQSQTDRCESDIAYTMTCRPTIV